MSAVSIFRILSYLLPLAVGSLVGFFFARQPQDGLADVAVDSTQKRTRLTAIGGATSEARVRKLLNDGSAPSELWAALELCDSDALARLYRVTGRELEGNARMRHLLVAASWVEVDPEAACRAAAAEWDGIMALPKVAGIWATSDPDAALDFLMESPEINGGGFAIDATVTSARTIPDFDMQPLVDRLSPSHESTRITFELTKGNRVEKLRELIIEPERLSPTMEAAADWGFEEFVDAALVSVPASELVALYSEPGGERLGEPSSALVVAYFKQDSAAAKEWIFNQHDEFEGAYIGNAIVSQIKEENPVGAAGLIGELPVSGARTESVIQLAESWSASDEVAYLDWYQHLDGADRQAIDAAFEAEDEEVVE